MPCTFFSPLSLPWPGQHSTHTWPISHFITLNNIQEMPSMLLSSDGVALGKRSSFLWSMHKALGSAPEATWPHGQWTWADRARAPHCALFSITTQQKKEISGTWEGHAKGQKAQSHLPAPLQAQLITPASGTSVLPVPVPVHCLWAIGIGAWAIRAWVTVMWWYMTSQSDPATLACSTLLPVSFSPSGHKLW